MIFRPTTSAYLHCTALLVHTQQTKTQPAQYASAFGRSKSERSVHGTIDEKENFFYLVSLILRGLLGSKFEVY